MTIILYRALAALSIVAALVGIGWMNGANHVQDKWDEAKLSETTFATVIRYKQADSTVQIVTKYVDRIRTVHVTGDTIIKEVPIYVPSDSPDLPGGFRVLHDAAAVGELPNPARIADADPVPAQNLGETIVWNYTTCRATAEQLISLQDWVRKQDEIYSNK